MTPSEKVAYLKGLVEGMAIDEETKEGKILVRIIDILEDLANGLEDAEENAYDIADELDQLSDDLADVESIVYDDDDCDCDCESCDGCEAEDEDEYAVVCPSCNEEIYVKDSDVEKGSVVCPNCSENLQLEYEFDDEESEEE